MIVTTTKTIETTTTTRTMMTKHDPDSELTIEVEAVGDPTIQMASVEETDSSADADDVGGATPETTAPVDEPTLVQKAAVDEATTLASTPAARGKKKPRSKGVRDTSSGPPPRRRGRIRRLYYSLSGRVLLGYMVLVTAAILVSLFLTNQMLTVRAQRAIDLELVQEAGELNNLTNGLNPQTAEPFADDVPAIFNSFLERQVLSTGEWVATFYEGSVFAVTIGTPPEVVNDATVTDPWISRVKPIWETRTFGEDETPHRLLVMPMVNSDNQALGTAVFGFDQTARTSEINDVIRIIAFVSAMVILFALLAAWSLTRRITKPIDDFTSTAQRISDADLSKRFGYPEYTELDEMSESFNEMLDRLERGFRAQSHALDDIAHELRTPITIVRGHLELLEDDAEERAATVDLCLDELDRMGRYLQDVMVVASADHPDFLRTKEISWAEFTETSFAKFSALGDRDWQLILPADDAQVEADADRLSQVVVNLANNAVQHTNVGDRITIESSVTPKEVHLSVTDTGPGVPPDFAESMFNRFSRGKASKQHRPTGTGLGLAIVSAIVDAHGGHVAHSAPEAGGATFTVSLPRRTYAENSDS